MNVALDLKLIVVFVVNVSANHWVVSYFYTTRSDDHSVFLVTLLSH